MKVLRNIGEGHGHRRFEVDAHLALKGELLLPGLKLARRLQALLPVLGELDGQNSPQYPLHIGKITDSSFVVSGKVADELYVPRITDCVAENPATIVTGPSRVGEHRLTQFYANLPFTRWDIGHIGEMERVGGVRHLDPSFYGRKAIEVFVEPAHGHDADEQVTRKITEYMTKMV